jgi:hypothetical protein
LRTDAAHQSYFKQIFCQLDGWSVVFAGYVPVLRTEPRSKTNILPIIWWTVVFTEHEPFLRTDDKQNTELKQIFCQLYGCSVVFAGHELFLQTDAKQNTELK